VEVVNPFPKSFCGLSSDVRYWTSGPQRSTGRGEEAVERVAEVEKWVENLLGVRKSQKRRLVMLAAILPLLCSAVFDVWFD